MNPKTIDHVCSRLVYAFHWRNVGSKDQINEMPMYRKPKPGVTVMDSVQDRMRNDGADVLNCTTELPIFGQRPVRSDFIVYRQ
jgi:hypothetical protein